MPTLHTVNKSPFERSTLESCLAHAVPGSSVLLIEDGVYGAIDGTRTAERVKEAMSNLAIYVLGPDLKARGMREDQVIDGIKVVDYAGFVDLATENDRVNSWL